MKVLNIVPAYGRTPQSEEKSIELWTSGKDWKILDISSFYDGAYCSNRDFIHMKRDGYTHVKLNFNGKSTLVEI